MCRHVHICDAFVCVHDMYSIYVCMYVCMYIYIYIYIYIYTSCNMYIKVFDLGFGDSFGINSDCQPDNGWSCVTVPFESLLVSRVYAELLYRTFAGTASTPDLA